MGLREKSVQVLKILSALAATLIAGCGNPNAVDSESLATQALWVGVRFEATGNGSTGVNVEINEGGRSGNDVRLSQNERLEVDANGFIVVLEEDEDFLDIDYEGRVTTDASDTLLTLSFYRADGSVNDGTRVTLPGIFAISSPSNDQEVVVGDVIDLQWAAPGSGMIALAITTQCSGFTRADFLDVPDNGSYAIDTAMLPGIQDPEIPRENGCALTVDLTRERHGTLDQAFRGGGFVSAVQMRTVKLQLAFN
ncbi:MAG: hypothetical protein KJO31_19340 [Gammaproteobacteria bacterium]|nr:hypothetical protein [Gammaproteobacteria bacterium]